MMLDNIKLFVAGITIGINNTVNSGTHRFEVRAPYRPFIASNDTKPELVLDLHYGDLPIHPSETGAFETNGPWRLLRREDEYVFRLHFNMIDGLPCLMDLVAVIVPSFRTGSLHMKADGYKQDRIPYPLQFPLDQLLLTKLLSKHGGAFIHGCGVDDGGRGLLFVGGSGAGKTTLASLWKRQRGATILNDERVAIRRKGHGLWLYGTPWHGQAGRPCSRGVPLEKVFFIEHAPRNELQLEARITATTALFVASFPPFYDPVGVENILTMFDQLTQTVPCYRLGFIPDESVIDFIRSIR